MRATSRSSDQRREINSGQHYVDAMCATERTQKVEGTRYVGVWDGIHRADETCTETVRCATSTVRGESVSCISELAWIVG